MTAHDLAMTMIREVLYETGITATAGIGTNLYLAKVAKDSEHDRHNNINHSEEDGLWQKE